MLSQGGRLQLPPVRPGECGECGEALAARAIRSVKQEVYSIDESFIGLHGVRDDLVERAWKIRARIHQWTDIPCGIGIGSTKTLAKLVNHIAKTAERKPGTYAD